MFVLILAREPVIRPRGTVDVIVSIFIRIRPSKLARKMYGFVLIHFRERFQTYTDSVDPIRVLVRTEGLNVSKSIRIRTNPRECGRALRMNRMFNYCSCWNNLLIQTIFVFDCNTEPKGNFRR